MTKSLEAKNRQVAEWLLGCWHENTLRLGVEQCIKCGKPWDLCSNPNFIAHPWELLRLMRERGDFKDLLIYCLDKAERPEYGSIVTYCSIIIDDYILDTTGKLLEAVWEWRGKHP